MYHKIFRRDNYQRTETYKKKLKVTQKRRRKQIRPKVSNPSKKRRYIICTKIGTIRERKGYTKIEWIEISAQSKFNLILSIYSV